MNPLPIIISFLVSLVEKIGLAWWKKHEQQEKATEIANAPVTNQEEAEFFK